MSSHSAIEIQFHQSEMVVYPNQKTINRPKLARKFSSAVRSALDSPRQNMVTDLVLDLSQIASISSAGLNELIRIHSDSRAAGVSVRFRSLQENVVEVFRITRLERIFDFESAPVDCPDRSISSLS